MDEETRAKMSKADMFIGLNRTYFRAIDEATPMTDHSYEDLCRAQTEQRLSILKLTHADVRFLKSLKIAV